MHRQQTHVCNGHWDDGGVVPAEPNLGQVKGALCVACLCVRASGDPFWGRSPSIPLGTTTVRDRVHNSTANWRVHGLSCMRLGQQQVVVVGFGGGGRQPSRLRAE